MIAFFWWRGLSALLLFSLIGSKQAHYLVPEMPVLALLVASALGRVTWRRALDWSAPLIAIGALVLAVLLGFGLIDTAEISTAPGTLVLALVALALVTLGGWVVGICAGSDGLVAGVDRRRQCGDQHNAHLAAVSHGCVRVGVRGVARGHQIAYFGDKYHAEFNFLARFETPVYLPNSQADILEWAASQTDGLVVAREDAVAFDLRPQQTIVYRGKAYGVWRAADLLR